MAWLAVNKDGTEVIFSSRPVREPYMDDGYATDSIWLASDDGVDLPSGSIEKLIGRPLTWSDEPVEI